MHHFKMSENNIEDLKKHSLVALYYIFTYLSTYKTLRLQIRILHNYICFTICRSFENIYLLIFLFN